MLAIRLQRTGRSGHAEFRLIVQDSHFSPKRGRVVAYLGSYNPHTKVAAIDSKTAAKYLENGAQPSDKAAQLLKKEGIKLPAWVKTPAKKKRAIKHPDKLRRNRPVGAPAPESPQPAAEETADAPDEASAKEEAQTPETTPEPEATASEEPPTEQSAEAETETEVAASEAAETSEPTEPEGTPS
ncbi:MAG: 30S ribosomal protein S16 [Candidatus Saccharimonadales bacterium]